MTLNMEIRTNKRIVLIGGGGFIGHRLANRMVSCGYHVTVFDQFFPNEEEQIPSVQYKYGDYSDATLLEEVISNQDEIVHLAYGKTVSVSKNNLEDELRKNLFSTIQLFDIAARFGVRVLYVSSGGTIYGEPESLPLKECHPKQPISAYGITKLMLEHCASYYASTKGLHVVCVRPSNPFGEGQKPFVGQGFIATVFGTAINGEIVKIFGEKGTVRDYIYIDDLVEGMLTALMHGSNGKVYNIGTSVGRNNLEVIHDIERMFFPEGIKVEHMPHRNSDVGSNVLDCRALQELGWNVEISFEEGLRRTYNWLKDK
jgi:UDP-glucose 4-epimerase